MFATATAATTGARSQPDRFAVAVAVAASQSIGLIDHTIQRRPSWPTTNLDDELPSSLIRLASRSIRDALAANRAPFESPVGPRMALVARGK